MNAKIAVGIMLSAMITVILGSIGRAVWENEDIPFWYNTMRGTVFISILIISITKFSETNKVN